MTAFDFDTPVDRAGTHTVKWDLRAPLFGNADAIPLWVADMDFPVAPAITEALKKRAEHPIYGYTLRPKSYYQALQAWLAKRHGFHIDTDWCLHSPTVVTSLSLLVETLTHPGDKVLIQAPVYAPFFRVIKVNGRTAVVNHLRSEDGFYSMDFDALERDLEGVKLAILCSPHNPVGRVWSRDELTRFANLCLAKGVTMISDEIHGDLIYSGHRHVPLASLSTDVSQHTVTCVSPSKTFNLAGMRASALVVENPVLRRRVATNFERFGLEDTNLFAIEAFEAAYRHGEPWLDALLAYLEKNRNTIDEVLGHKAPWVKCRRAEGTYLAWLDLRSLQLDEPDLKHFLFQKVGVALESGTKFGPGGEGFARLNFACPRSLLAQGLESLVNQESF